MSVSELFYQSALINTGIFLWLASIMSTIAIFIRSEKKISLALVMSCLFGPLALLCAWIYDARSSSQKKSSMNVMRGGFAVVLVTSLIALSFFFLFIKNYAGVAISSEVLPSRIAIFIAIAGFIAGIILSGITKRIAFLSTCWTVCTSSLIAISLRDWAQDVFSYGSSSTYFLTLLLVGSVLLLLFLVLGGSLGYLLFGEGQLNAHFGYEKYIGVRFLMTKRSSHVVSLITVISIFAVMIACGGMIVVLSVMNGFTSDLRSKILGANAHLMLLKYGKDFSEHEDIIQKTKNLSGVTSLSAFIVNEGMVSSARNLSGAIITGIDLTRIEQTGRLKYVDEKALNFLKNPSSIPRVTQIKSAEDLDEMPGTEAELPGVILGKEMALSLQVMVGDPVNLISPIGDIGPTGPMPKARPFLMAGIFDSGMYDFDSKFVYIALADAQSFFNLGTNVTGIEYRLLDIENTRAVAKEISDVVGGYPFYSRDWMQMNKNMFSALQLEKIVMLIILSTYIFMASLLILVTLIMVVMEKGKEIAILKSMGATDVSIMKIFVTYGLFIGGLGAILGGALGVILCFFIEKVGIRLDPDVYYFASLPVRVVASEIFLVIGAAILISFLATIPPSLFAARLRPVEGLRYE